MEKQLRSSLQSSAEEFLATASKFALKSSRTALKALIHGVEASSDLCSSLPVSLHHSISRSVESFSNPKYNQTTVDSLVSPPTKRSRRSSRRAKPEREPGGEGEDKQKIVQSLHVFAYISRLCVSHPENVFPAEDFLAGARLLHDNLIGFDSDTELSSEIANLCEDWWKRGLVGRESLISQFLPLLLSRSLTSTKKNEVHRVYALREAFVLFDFEDESIEDLKLLIIRCVVAPMYMKTEEGRRFVAFAFGLSAQLLKELLAMIRSQIPLGGKSMLEAYGDVIFRAWKVAEDGSRDEIENRFLQGLTEGAIYARTEALGVSVRRVLGAFINQKTTNGVDKLLFRLSEPLIFRSLQVSNSNVRKNALHLLLDLFPLEDPDSTKEEKDTLLSTQFYLLEKLLVDNCPDIRVVAVEGCCRVLHLFWEIIPSPTIPKVLFKIFDDMSHDISNEVRLSTLNGVIYLLGNPQSHEILKVLLPRFRHLMLDKVLSIRRAVVDLLIVVRDIKDFQFNKVVGLDVLLDSLANDQADVAQRITKLLIPSYFPSKASTDDACDRCFALIRRSPLAGARFCELAGLEGASHKSLMELAKALVGLVTSAEKLHEDHVDGLLLSLANICSTLCSQPNYKEALKELFLGEKLKTLFGKATRKRAQSSVFRIASFVSADEVDVLLDGCMRLITDCKGLSSDIEKQVEVRSAHQLFLSSGTLDCMLEVLLSRLHKTAYHCHLKYGTEVPKSGTSSAKRKKNVPSSKISAKWKHVGGKKPTDFEDDYTVSVGIAWQIKDLLKSKDTRKAVLESQSLRSVFLALKLISEISILQCRDCEYMDVSPVLAYTALSLHMTLENISVSSSKDGNKKNDCSDSSGPRKTVMEQTLDHIISCTTQLFEAVDLQKSAKSPSERKNAKSTPRQRQKDLEADASHQGDTGSSLSEPKRLSNKMKMSTTVLQFTTDAATMGFAFHNHERFLKFTSDYIRNINSTLKRHQNNEIIYDELDLNETILCLKSSLTYAAKLLSLSLKDSSEDSPPQSQPLILANDVIDVITSVELYLGTIHASKIVSSVKPWLPDFVLAFASGQILKPVSQEKSEETMTLLDCLKIKFPSWLSVLAKSELSEMSKSSLEDENDEDSESEEIEFPIFGKLMETFVALMKKNPFVLDSIGEIFLVASLVGLELKDYDLVLGLVRFVCVKLYTDDEREWGDLMTDSLQNLYRSIEKLIGEEDDDEDRRQKLESAKALLQPFWMHHLYQTGNLFAENDE